MDERAIGLALGAGGARGIAHVHVLRALDDLGIRTCAISGTSMGAIIGACYANGMCGDDVRAFLLQRFGDRKSILESIWAVRARSINELTGSGRPRLGELNLERILELLLPSSLPHHIEDLPTNMQIVATRYFHHDSAVFASGPLVPALAASAAMPAVFKPVVIDGIVHIDGGTTNPVPIDVLQDKATFVIGVDVSGGPDGNEGTLPGKADVLYAASQLMQRAIVQEKMQRMRCDIMLVPNVGAWRVLDLMRTDEVLKATEPLYEETKIAVAKALEQRSVPAI